MYTTENWNHVKADIFWAEIAPCDHVVQIYESDGVFIDALAGFVGCGINAGDCCIVIATSAHLESLHHRLESYGIRMDTLVEDHRYMPIMAEEMLSKFMVNGWPDEKLFMKCVSEVIMTARKDKRKVRAFGEMVALLWAQGHSGATVHLEHLWNKFCAKETLCLFCAYPKSGFTGDIASSVNHICAAHSKMISGSEKQLTEIFYQESRAIA
jgi:MEDS: MEthanogen/methylotroph, DcmR Sensory domain